MIFRWSRDWGATFEEESTKKQWLDDNVISFLKDDVQKIQTLHDDAIVVSAMMANFDIKKILIDNKNLNDVLFYLILFRIRLSTDRLRRVSMSLISFIRNAVSMEEKITLPLTVGTDPWQSTILLTFTIVQVPSTYNAILGWSWLNTLRAVVSTYHLLI